MRTNSVDSGFSKTFQAKPIARIKNVGNTDTILFLLNGKKDKKYLQSLKAKCEANPDLFDNEIQKMIISQAAGDIYSQNTTWLLGVQDKKAFGLININKDRLFKTGI